MPWCLTDPSYDDSSRLLFSRLLSARRYNVLITYFSTGSFHRPRTLSQINIILCIFLQLYFYYLYLLLTRL